jgi:hypothetical protein
VATHLLVPSASAAFATTEDISGKEDVSTPTLASLGEDTKVNLEFN